MEANATSKLSSMALASTRDDETSCSVGPLDLYTKILKFGRFNQGLKGSKLNVGCGGVAEERSLMWMIVPSPPCDLRKTKVSLSSAFPVVNIYM